MIRAIEPYQFFNLFSYFNHDSQNVLNGDTLTFEDVVLLRDIKLNDGSSLLAGTIFDTVWFDLSKMMFDFIVWKEISLDVYEPEVRLQASQNNLIDQAKGSDNVS